MFINFSNHPSSRWSEDQIRAAEAYGTIVDIPFPAVPAAADEYEIQQLSEKYLLKIRMLKPSCVLCQGEFTLSYCIITALLRDGIKTVAACSERISRESTVDGVTEKTAVFRFVQFREYGTAGEKKGPRDAI